MDQPPDEYRIGLVGAAPRLAERCADALEGFGTVTEIDRHEVGAHTSSEVDLVLVALSGPTREGVALAVELRQKLPGIPTIVLAPATDANFAVEILKCGAADDFLLLPLHPQGLRGKVVRALLDRPGPAFPWPELEPLAQTEARLKAPAADNRRRCFRAPVPSHFAVSSSAVISTDPPRSVCLVVEDISVEVGDAPGGMLLLARNEAALLLPLSEWKSGEPIKLLVHIGDGSAPIPVVARMAGGMRPGPRSAKRMGVRYEPTNKADVPRLQRFWMACQRIVKK
ncbi:MAG: hypothetical protein HYY06_21255 [Deltaproteobacteria bacterium]|nr:hypothetical protein [Deltaproteobacteria bacterium]